MRRYKLWAGFTMILACFTLAIAAAQAASPIAVVRSEHNINAYQEAHLGNSDEAWLAFTQTLQSANLRYDLLSDADVAQGLAKLKDYKLIVVPLNIDLPPEDVFALTEFTRNGGKLLITDGGGAVGDNGKVIEVLGGAVVDRHTTTTEGTQLIWKRDPLPTTTEFSIGTLIANITPTTEGKLLAVWQEGSNNLGVGITRGANAAFLGWAVGIQGEISSNASLVSDAIEELVPGLVQQAAVQISFADYQTTCNELDYLAKRTEEAIKTARQADLAVPFKTIQTNYDSALEHVKAFQNAYQAREFYVADDELQKARNEFAIAFAKSMPVRPVEARSVWLDRGTIVATRNPAGMAELFDKLKSAGINVVYFETNNAGFCMYPSRLSSQNPDTMGWDPLDAAVKQAHKRNMELHAWMWIFNVGNIKHNPIIGKEPDYPGPVLSSHDFSWALAGKDGAFVPVGQSEFWIDPANKDGCRFTKNLILEVVQNYPVDGIQYDYIRYPFNSKGKEMGFDWVGRNRFEQETGLSLDKLDDNTREVWQAWKIQQVNNFVRDVSTTLKTLKPGFRISAAVYALPLRWRLNAIQQEWETWVSNGWVDTINPMTYVQTAPELATKASAVREATNDKALVFPGLSIRQLDVAGLIEQLDTSRAIGTLGTTMFAMAQLDDKKMALLKAGPYRRQPLLTPNVRPVAASRLLLDDFSSMLNRYLQDPHKKIMSDQSSTNEVLTQLMQIQHSLHAVKETSSPEELETINSNIKSLHANVKEWLRLEAFIQRGFRAQYIVNYLGQVEAIMSYAAQRARVQRDLLNGATAQTVPSGQPSLRLPGETNAQEPDNAIKKVTGTVNATPIAGGQVQR